MLNQSPMEARQAAQDLVKYRANFRMFAEEQLKLSGQPFRFWATQTALVESVERQFEEKKFARCVWLKARQTGASTLAQAFVAWRAMLWPHVNAIVIADEAERSKTLFEICRGFYDQLDDHIRPIGRYVTKRELVFANPSIATRLSDPGLRSRIVIDSAHKKNIAIGAAWNIAHLSECARFKDPSFVMDGVIPAVHRVPGTMIIMESSAEMAGTWFRDFFSDSQKGRTAFDAKFVPWYFQPEYFVCPVCSKNQCDEKGHDIKGAQTLDLMAEERAIMTEFGLRPGHIRWMREKLSELGNDWNLFRQNFPLTADDAWITPGAQVFPAKALKEQRQNIQPPVRRCEVHPGPKILDAPNGKLWVWEEPQAGKAYDVGVDIAQGGREDENEEREWGDYSVACVLERGSNKQVAEWASRSIDPLEMATVLHWLGLYYNSAQVAVETNGIGGSTNQQLARMGYVNCLTPDHRVLTADMRWVQIGDLVEGDQLVGFDENTLPGRRLRRYRSAKVMGCIPRREEVYRIVLSDGTEFKATGEHQWLSTKLGTAKNAWIATKNILVGQRFPKYFTPWSELLSHDGGWMSGIIDGEGSGGCYSLKSGREQTALTISQNPGLVLDKVCDLLRRWSFSFCVHDDHHDVSDTKRIRISKKSEIARLLGMTQPVRLLSNFHPEWFRALRAEDKAHVLAVEKLGKRDIVTFGTSTETYIAEGYATHNCYVWRYRDEVSPRYSKKTGWETNPRSKPWLIGFAIHELTNNRVIIRSELLYREMEQFVQKAAREWGAVAGAYDDRVMAWLIALLVSDDENFEKYYGLSKNMSQRPEAKSSDKYIPGPWERDETFNKQHKTKDDHSPWDYDELSWNIESFRYD